MNGWIKLGIAAATCAAAGFLGYRTGTKVMDECINQKLHKIATGRYPDEARAEAAAEAAGVKK